MNLKGGYRMKRANNRANTIDTPCLVFISEDYLPKAMDLEEVILGSIILESTTNHVKAVLPKIQPYHFFDTSYQLVCKAIKILYQEELPIDILTVIERLRKHGDLRTVGGPIFVTRLTNRVVSSVNIEYWFRIIYQKFIQREIIRIGLLKVNLALQDITDVFDLLDNFILELEKINPIREEKVVMTADRLGKEMSQEFVLTKTSKRLSLFRKDYHLGWPRFDEVVTLGKDKIILIAGAASAGKSRFIRSIVYRLLERYPDVSICWITLEDSRQDLLRSYLASKVYITAKHLKSGKYDRGKIGLLKRHTQSFQQFDIEFIDQAIRSEEIVNHFTQFCDKRRERFNVLVVDNILSLDDQNDFKFDPNGFSNHVMHNLLKCRQKTQGLIIPLHHFNDAQQNKDNLKTGYRPVLKDMKGSETFRRTPNQVLLINSFNIYKDLMSEYSGDEHDILEHIFIVDAGKNREDKINDSSALIHFFTEMAYDQFYEIPLPENNQTSTN